MSTKTDAEVIRFLKEALLIHQFNVLLYYIPKPPITGGIITKKCKVSYELTSSYILQLVLGAGREAMWPAIKKKWPRPWPTVRAAKKRPDD
ncbi:hypothetical protein BpHYR1_040415 [Brachionus plicatilis]|uniref:Uncharacterized protein n=1 Tax=Brachionus plicatilis TaxID=10195 RepID=A0A3M7PS12_BRAPC|nr:hypothetical protein BpHYR1_040415 [Brachionus plicatilis]